MVPLPKISSFIFASLVVFLCYCCGSSRNLVVAVGNDDSSKEATKATATFLRRSTENRVHVVVNDGAVEDERELMPLVSNKCGCSTCTEEVLNTDAGGFSCGARIDWMVDSMSYIVEDACNLVAGEEFPFGMYCIVLYCTAWMMNMLLAFCEFSSSNNILIFF
jgi:hypothetical protein